MHNEPFSRRGLLKAGAGLTLSSSPLGSCFAEQSSRAKLTTRAITAGPKHHWFGYYDKWQFDISNRFVLGMEVDFEHRSPTGDDRIQIGMVDLDSKDRWIPLGQSTAWCWQQGCMLQWLPGSSTKAIWNDRESDRFVSRIMDVKTREVTTIPHPIYSVSPNGKTAVTLDFRRVNDVRPGYGYAGLADPHADELAPDDTGVFAVDLESGTAKLIVSLADIARNGPIPMPQPGIKHYFNHLLFSPDGARFIALHRWRYPNGSRLTRMITANIDGSDLRIVCPNGYTSHFIWRDAQSILAQSRHYDDNSNWGNFLFSDQDGGGKVKEVGRGVLDPSGHVSYLPGNKWILNDTYPKGKERMQTPHLYRIDGGKRIDLGQFHLPVVYRGEWRVDTHPRFSRDGRLVCIDAPVAGQGRQLHLLDIGDII